MPMDVPAVNRSRTAIGRFAPSPTGPLHFGSLVAAVGSYCDARAQHGKWLLRMEDIDPPREQKGAANLILHQLENYGFEWDGPVLYQHTRYDAYQAALAQLQAQGDIFWCRCSRSELALHRSPIYTGRCREFCTPLADAAIRLRVPDRLVCFTDRLLGEHQDNVAHTVGDFVIRRRDQLFAYQLAVVVDDAYQGITDVVRGADLLDNTARQIVLQQLLGVPTPRYMHLPLVRHADGQKLSKQSFAPALPLPAQPLLLWQALHFLGQHPPIELQNMPAPAILHWGVTHWQIARIPSQV